MPTTTLNINNNQNLDAFYRLRISNPQTIFDSKQIHDNQPLFWDDQEVSGTGTSSTYSKPYARTRIGVTNVTAGKRIRQTFRRFDYQPGKSQLVIETFVMSACTGDSYIEVGQHDDNNGIFMKKDVNGVYVGIRSSVTGSPVDNLVHQNTAIYSTDATSTWNIDKMDGTGASGLTIDWTKNVIFFFDYEWLGVGTVALGVFINRKPYYIHYFNHSNLTEQVYMSTPNNPLRYLVSNGGTGNAATLDHICSTVITEGGRQETGIKKGIVRDALAVGLTTGNNTNLYPLIGIRLKTANLGSLIEVLHAHIMATSTADYAWQIVLNPTVAGTAPTWIGKTNSGIEYCFPTGSTTLTDNTGEVLDCGLGSDSNQSKGGTETNTQSDLKLGAKIDGTPDEIYLAVRSIAAGIEVYYATLTFKET